jgi:hypothetical protein
MASTQDHSWVDAEMSPAARAAKDLRAAAGGSQCLPGREAFMISIEADRIASFGTVESDTTFVLVTNTRLVPEFTIVTEGKYARTLIVAHDSDAPLTPQLGTTIPERSHILSVLPDTLLHSVPRAALKQFKLLIMACRSGRIGLDGIAHFLKCGYATDVESQQGAASEFFRKGEASKSLRLLNHTCGSACDFDHLNDVYEWHEQTGFLEWGDQQVYPAGEVACFAVPLYLDNLEKGAVVSLNGTIALHGLPIVQSGPPSFQLEDQLRIYTALSVLVDSTIILTVRDGVILDHRASDVVAAPAADMLSCLFAVDSRYRNVYEIGFSINEQLEPWEGNAAMNEVWGQGGGNVHLGLGMLPHTQYHLDLFCAGTSVQNERGEHVFGPISVASDPKPSGALRRTRSAGCPCQAV